MIASIRHRIISLQVFHMEFLIALSEGAPPLSPAFARVPGLKSRRRELLATLRAIEDEQE